MDQGIVLENLSQIFVTHLHCDYCLELGPLIYTPWTAGLKMKINIDGPKNLEAYWNNFLESMDVDVETRIEDEVRLNLNELVRFRVVEKGLVVEQ